MRKCNQSYDEDDELYDECGLDENLSLITSCLGELYANNFSNLLQERKILWNYAVTSRIVDISMYILRWNKEDELDELEPEERKPIYFYINTNGGDYDSVIQLIDIIRLSKTPVITVGLGRIYSAGALLFLAGHKRYILEDTVCLIHGGWATIDNDLNKMYDSYEMLTKQNKRCNRYILSRTKIPEKLYYKNIRKEWYIFSDEMIKLGIADGIVTDLSMIS